MSRRDPYSSAKAKVLAEIARLKAGPDSEAKLREMLAKAMQGWGGMVREIGQAHAVVNDIAATVGIERDSGMADLVEFPNWVVHQLRIALGDAEE